MKHPILSIIILWFGVISYVDAQKFYVQLRGGYGIPAANDDLGSPLSELGDSDFSLSESGMVSDKSLYGSLGRGANVGIGFGYCITDHLIGELGLGYTTGPKLLDARVSTPDYFAEQHSQASGFLIAPSLIMQSGGEKVKLYLKVGGAIPIGGSIITTINAVDDENRLMCRFTPCGGASTHPTADMHVELEAEGKTTGVMPFGFTSGIGVRYHVGARGSFFIETNFVAMTMKSKETVYSKFDVEADGTIFPFVPLELSLTLDDLDTYEKHILYEDVITENSNNAAYNADYNSDLPMDERAIKTNLNNISLIVGVQYHF